jgi:hypothetical protein
MRNAELKIQKKKKTRAKDSRFRVQRFKVKGPVRLVLLVSLVVLN